MIRKELQKIKYFLQNLILFLSLLLCVSEVCAQEADTIVPFVKEPEKILRKIDIRDVVRNGLNFWQDEFSGHWAGFDFGFNMFLNEDYSGYDSHFMNNDVFRSNAAFINFIQQSVGLHRTRNTIGLVTGMGLQLQSFRLDENTTIYKDESGVIYPEELYFADNQKSKFSIVWLTIPLLAEVQIPVNHYENRVYFSAGVLGGLRLGSHTKIKYKSEQKEKLKVVDDFSIHDFKYSAMVRVGYRWLNIFASCDLVPLFKNDKGPELTPFSFGVTLLRF